jgi:hypothetical protein
MPSLKEWNQIIHNIGDLTHEVKLLHDPSPYLLCEWCLAHVGDKYVTWAYADSVWYFKDNSAAMEFALTWS